jgi:hypothetical protein
MPVLLRLQQLVWQGSPCIEAEGTQALGPSRSPNQHHRVEDSHLGPTSASAERGSKTSSLGSLCLKPHLP